MYVTVFVISPISWLHITGFLTAGEKIGENLSRGPDVMWKITSGG